MSLNDPLANVLSMINNYERTGKKEVVTLNTSKTIKKVLEILNETGYLGGNEEIIDSKGNVLKINLIGNINKVGVIKPRFAVNKDGYEKWEKRYLPAKGFGLIIVSTNQGIMTHDQAKEKQMGGKLLAYVY